MPTFDEIGKAYASQLTEALNRDGFTKSASADDIETRIRTSETQKVLKGIANDLARKWTVNDKPLTEEQKQEIYRSITKSLSVLSEDAVPGAVKAASNDAYMQLVNDIGKIVKEKK